MDKVQSRLMQLNEIEKKISSLLREGGLAIEIIVKKSTTKEDESLLKDAFQSHVKKYMELLEVCLKINKSFLMSEKDVSVQLRNQVKALEEDRVPINTIPKLHDFAREKNIEHWKKVEMFLKKLQVEQKEL